MPAFFKNIQSFFKQFPVSEKFGQDVFWNLASLIFLALSGILLSVIIGRVYGPSVLGSFNQVYAVYIVCSQFAAMGIHLSTVKHVAEYHSDRPTCRVLAGSAVRLVLLTASVVCLFLYVAGPAIGRLLKSDNVAAGFSYIAPAVLFFALNKVLLAVLNGERRMKAYASFHALRYVLILVVLLLCAAFRQDGRVLPVVFTAAEVILSGCLFLFLGPVFTFRGREQVAWMKRHFIFGLKSLLGGTLAELNTRIDVIMLGLFMSDREVGIYSFAAIVVEGFVQFLVVLRTNVNPVLTRLYTERQDDKLNEVIRKGVDLLYPVMALFGIGAALVYPLFVKFLMPENEFLLSWPAFGILVAGLIASSGYFPFNMLLTQTGFPGRNTIMTGLVVATNIALNAVLIPAFGMNGAAVATCLSFIAGVLFLKLMVERTLDLRI